MTIHLVKISPLGGNEDTVFDEIVESKSVDTAGRDAITQAYSRLGIQFYARGTYPAPDGAVVSGSRRAEAEANAAKPVPSTPAK
jgi:hypothetical protein